MKVFLSHAISDKELVEMFQSSIKKTGVELVITEHNYSLTESITQKIELMIRQSHIALFLLTENGFNSTFVQQEIGYIHSLRKPAIYVVQKGLEKKVAGFNFGKDYLQLDPADPTPALKRVKQLLLNQYKKRQLAIESAAQSQKEIAAGITILASVFILASLASSK